MLWSTKATSSILTKNLFPKKCSFSRFYELFGDPVLNEKGWEKQSLFNLTLKIGSGATPKGGRESYVSEGTSFIRSMNVYDNQFLYKDLVYLTDEQANKLD